MKPLADSVDLTADQAFLAAIGQRVRNARKERGMTRKQLSIQCGVSERHLAQLETGRGNISVRLLKKISDAVITPMENLVRVSAVPTEFDALINRLDQLPLIDRMALLDQANQWLSANQEQIRESRVALIGLRGAGKSTLGRRCSDGLGRLFIELDQEITRFSGLATEEIFGVYGEQHYRQLERQCVVNIIANHQNCIVAAAGGIVSSPDTFALLLRGFHVIWITAEPEEHMGRVIAQGDRRPMQGNPDAMINLRRLLSARVPLYEQAHFRIDTSGKTVTECSSELTSIIQSSCPVLSGDAKHTPGPISRVKN